MTTISTTTTTIANAAFLQEVKESNSQLWVLLKDLRELNVADKTLENSKQFVTKLGELRDSIALEFSLEETYGFIDGVPMSSGLGLVDAGKAKVQHRELYLQLHETCEEVEEAQYRGTIGRDLAIYFGAFEQFDDSLRAHEDFEAELIRSGLGARIDDF
ncbi:MAG: hypothetical protein VXZ82_00785 [Planctomycetota bacterium]|nr:hypothetical protein [Planctomycetota bacterium]